MASLKDLINKLEKMSSDDSVMNELGNIIGSMMVQESKDSLFTPKSGKLNRRTGGIRSRIGEPPAYDKGEFFDNTSHFVQVNKRGATIVTLKNDTEYAHRVEIGYNRPYLSYGRDKVLEDKAEIGRVINEVFYDWFKKNLG